MTTTPTTPTTQTATSAGEQTILARFATRTRRATRRSFAAGSFALL